jgi:hypothetical protein
MFCAKGEGERVSKTGIEGFFGFPYFAPSALYYL